MKLSNNDYITIVKHYGYSIPKTKKNRINMSKTRKLARNILASKLCKCIKKVQKTNKTLQEPAAISICNNSIFRKRNLKHYRFTCKKNYVLKNKKGSNYALTKTNKKLKMKPKK
jgi:hypothetical protein